MRQSKCKRCEGRPSDIYYDAVVDGDPYDSHAARTAADAVAIANPDRGSRIVIWEVRADGPGVARMPFHYEKHGRVIKRLRKK